MYHHVETRDLNENQLKYHLKASQKAIDKLPCLIFIVDLDVLNALHCHTGIICKINILRLWKQKLSFERPCVKIYIYILLSYVNSIVEMNERTNYIY